MHNIEKYVTQFRREFHIHSLPTLNNLENIIVCNLFYKLLPYQGNEALFYSLVKKPDIKCKTAIAIRSGDQRYIFYNDNIPYQDRLYIFAHEIAHIYMNHYSRDDGYMDTSYRKEREANEFATLLLQKPKKHLGMYILCAIIGFLIAASFLFTDFIGIVKNASPIEAVFNQNITPFYIGISDEMVVITSTGKKYHKSDCRYVKDKSNLKITTINEATMDGYSQCLNCFK